MPSELVKHFADRGIAYRRKSAARHVIVLVCNIARLLGERYLLVHLFSTCHSGDLNRIIFYFLNATCSKKPKFSLLPSYLDLTPPPSNHSTFYTSLCLSSLCVAAKKCGRLPIMPYYDLHVCILRLFQAFL